MSILIYHRVLTEADPFRDGDIDSKTFDWHMELVSKEFNVLSLEEAVERLDKQALPPRSLCVTFDDGYADNYLTALPILKKWNVPATFFIATSYLDGGCMWNDIIIDSIKATRREELNLEKIGLPRYPLTSTQEKIAAVCDVLNKVKHLPQARRADSVRYINEFTDTPIPKDLMMQSGQVKKLREAGMCIGGHTASHPILSTLDYNDAYEEIHDGIARLEGILGEQIRYFAYPNGKPTRDYNRDHVAIVKKLNIKAAVSTSVGVSSTGSDVFQLPRFTPWDNNPAKYYLRLLMNCRVRNYQQV